MKTKKPNNYILNVLFVLIVGLLLFYAVLKSDAQKIIPILMNADLKYVTISIGMVFVWIILAGIILTIFTRIFKNDYKYKEGILNAFIANFFHGITPGASGGQVAQVYVYYKQGLQQSISSSILLMDFIVYQIALCVLSVFLLLLRFVEYYQNFSNFFLFAFLGFMLNLSVVFFLFLLLKSKRFHNWIIKYGIKIAVHFHIYKNQEEAIIKFENFFESFRENIQILKEHQNVLIITFLLNILRLILYYSIATMLFKAYGQTIDFNRYIDILAMSSFLAMMSGLIIIPGASGASELLFIYLFSNLFENIIVKSTMLSWRFLTYYFTMFIGAFCFIYIKIRGRS